MKWQKKKTFTSVWAAEADEMVEEHDYIYSGNGTQ